MYIAVTVLSFDSFGVPLFSLDMLVLIPVRGRMRLLFQMNLVVLQSVGLKNMAAAM